MSKILLGGTEMCEHNLGHDIVNIWGSWTGSYGVGAVILFSHSITVVRDGGAPVYGLTNFTGYTSAGIAGVAGANWVDGVFQQAWGGQFPGSGSTHWPVGFEWFTAPLAKGAHTIWTGVYVTSPTFTFDANDGGTSICWEHP